jgi:CheY-like chemotaxis protein
MTTRERKTGESNSAGSNRPGQFATDPVRGTVVVLDDDTTFRDTVRMSLQNAGFAAYAAEDIAELMKVFETMHVDVIVADNVLADGNNGWVEANALRARYPDLRVVNTSGYDGEVIEEYGRAVDQKYVLKGDGGLRIVEEVIRAMREG